MVTFIEEQRDRYGVEPICEVLPIAPSTFYELQARKENPELRPQRAKRDEALRPQIQRVWDESHDGVYGADKVWKQLNREDISVARCTVERLMRGMGLSGVKRGAFKVTTVSDAEAGRRTWLTATSARRGRTNSGWLI